MGKVLAVNISEKKGTPKSQVEKAFMRENYGIEGDAHSGDWHRQVSLLDIESIRGMEEKGYKVNIGDFAENITTEGIDLTELKIGDVLKVGEGIIEITQIGKECHTKCGVFKRVGDCIMPKKGIFARVLKGCEIKAGEEIRFVPEINVGILTLSDKGSKGEREDKSGEKIRNLIRQINGKVAKYEVLPDELDEIADKLKQWCEPSEKLDLIITTGGTGFSKRDVTPEATSKVVQRLVPGLSETMRSEGYKFNHRAILSRGISGICNNTLIINLPGSVRGVEQSLDAVLDVIPHGVEILKGEASECGQGS